MKFGYGFKAVVFACLALTAAPALATSFLVYLDVSTSARQFHQNYVQDIAKFADRNFNSGDKVVLLALGQETQQFNPFASFELAPPSGGVSEKRKREALEGARGDIVAAVAVQLKKNIKANSTNILGAMVSASDYFQQNQVAPKDRSVILFTDGIEQSAINNINMGKVIPSSVPPNIKLPANLSARLYMIGVYPPNKPGAQETLRTFWKDAAAKTGSTLVQYIMRFE